MIDTLYLEGAYPARTGVTNSHDTEASRTNDRLTGDLSSVCGVVNATAARMVAVISEVVATDAWKWPGIRSAAHWVGWHCGVTPGHAQDLVRMAARLPDMPVCRGLFEAGQLSEDHIKIICRRVPTAYEADVAELALVCTSTQLSHVVNEYPFDGDDEEDTSEQRRVSFGSVSDELWRLHAKLHPDEGKLLEQALRAARDGLFAECDEQADGDQELAKKLKEQVTWADAMVRLGDSYLGGRTQARATRDQYRVLIHLNATRRFDAQPSTDGPTSPDPAKPEDAVPEDERSEPAPAPADSDSTGPGAAEAAADPPASHAEPEPAKPAGAQASSAFTLPGLGADAPEVEPHAHFHLGCALPDSLRRLITCDTDLTPVFAYQGVVHHVGTSQRTVLDRTRWAIEQRDKGCRVPGCGRTLRLQIHHIIHWEDGGPTQTWNLCALCARHHREHHTGGLGIDGDADDPDGLSFTDNHGNIIRPPGSPPPIRGHPYTAAHHLDIPVAPYDYARNERADWRWLMLYKRPPGEGSTN